MSHERENWPFVSIVSWPKGWDRNQMAERLASVGRTDIATIPMRLGQKPPMVLMQVEPVVAERMTAVLLKAHGDAFTFTFENLAALGPALSIKDMRVVEGALEMVLWNGMSTSLPMTDVEILVRAHLSRTVVERRDPPSLSSMHRITRSPDSIRAEIEASVTKNVQTSDRLDIHTLDAGIYRVAADRFGFGLLGDLRGYGDKANTDSLCELLCHLAPEAIVDTYYPLWRPPVGYQRVHVKGMERGRDDPSFEFYSRWAGLMYRHVSSG